MKRQIVVVGAVVILVLAGVTGPGGARAARPDAGDFATSHCATKWTKKKVHGKTQRVKVRVCHTEKAKPTATPTITPSPTPVPANVSVSPTASTPGFTASQAGTAYSFVDTTYGAKINLSQITIAKNQSGDYNIYVDIAATKVASSMDSQYPEWLPDNSMLELVASNQHPYRFYAFGCNRNPGFSSDDLYDGESAQGWMCSDDIAPQNVAGSYTLYWHDTAGDSYLTVPLLTLTVVAPNP